MSLRQKALLLTTLTLAGLMLILATVSTAIWFDSAAQTATRTLMISLLLIGLVFGALTLILMDRFILRRLAQLQTSVEHIAASGDLSARVPVTAHDELSRLARSINGMLAALEQAQQENARLLEELRAANERLTELDRLKNQFVANASHELRTPLNAILGFSELLGDEVPGPLNDEQRDYVRHLDTSGRHLLALINDILDLSKLQAQRIELQRRTAYLSDIVAAAQTFVWPAAQRKRQTITIDVPPELPSLYADPLRVKQVLINLLNNACKFTPPEGRIAVQAEVWRDGWLRIGVSDSGPGIPPDKQAEVFEEFAQLNWDRPVVERGTGLGLAIARRLIELHGGQIWVDSTGQPGEGAVFYFTLPLADAALRRAATRILAVVDDQLIIDLLQAMLRLPEYEVIETTEPACVLDRALRDRPDMILLDLTLLHVKSLEILSALRQEPRTSRIPLIVLTAQPLAADEQPEIYRLAQAVVTKTKLRRETLSSALQQARQTPVPPL